MAHFYWRDDTLFLTCFVQPKASRDEIVGLHNDALKIRIAAPPIDGKANRHLIDYLSKLFEVPKKNVKIVRGLSGRDKTVAITQPQTVPESTLIAS